MKRFITVILSFLITTTLSAQEKEFLSAFTAIDVDAQIQLKLVKLKESDAPYIIFDTKGDKDTRFSFEQKSGTLKIRERHDSQRKNVTEVTIGFCTLSDITIAKADTKVEGVLTSRLLDIYISHNAHFTAEVDVLDIIVYASGKSRVEISGHTVYHTADISSAHYNTQNLQSTSTIVESAHNAVARVNADDRLKMQTSTGGKIYYHSQPVILRSRVTTFGGEISRAK
ncbi:MAG: DUF2807 domain-containing protein [Alistipes sp.]|nr:DUF2807 domain-containing protein [Alistipes sp.]